MRNLTKNRLSELKARPTTLPKQDPYADAHKPSGVVTCTACHAFHERGHWKWGAVPSGASTALCPACRRIKDRCPAHVLRLDGVPKDRRQELVALVHRVAEEECRDHPLERLMSLEDAADLIEIRTTGAQLPRRLRASIARAFRQRFASKFSAEHSAMTWKAAAPH
jgi:NAD-dependent dihydropyrimidine dehydrogenase PreA subunit